MSAFLYKNKKVGKTSGTKKKKEKENGKKHADHKGNDARFGSFDVRRERMQKGKTLFQNSFG